MPAKTSVIVMWFRQDLRVADNPALLHACNSSRPVLPIYILDEKNCGRWKIGAASRWWLQESLGRLNESLAGNLCFAKGDPRSIFEKLAQRFSVEGIFWNRCYEPWRIARDTEIKKALEVEGISAKSWNGSLLVEPHVLVKEDGKPYRVFTHYFKKFLRTHSSMIRKPLGAPQKRDFIGCKICELDELELLPEIPRYREMKEQWRPGEKGAQYRLERFLEAGLEGYRIGRDFPALEHVSRLSPHLHFGEISPNQIWSGVVESPLYETRKPDAEYFVRELAWREFSYNLLYFFPDLPNRNLRAKFDIFPWTENGCHLEAWQKGRTGFPIVDAGMRELLRTGYMHNRVRMIAGSFLVKNLLLHWRCGEKWFWNTLVDADLANNSANWQWVAGCGADAVPYFRIFNPVSQGQKFDSDGFYVRKFCPELSKLPNRFLHAPWLAPAAILEDAGVTLGQSYPCPIVDLKGSRARALEAFAQTKDYSSRDV